MRPSALRAAAFSLIAVTVLAGCSHSRQPAEPTSITMDASTDAPSEQTAPDPASVPGGSWNQTFHVTDSAGYTFDFDLSFSVLSMNKTIVDDMPGFSTIHYDTSSSMRITNTTEGRNLPVPLLTGYTSPANEMPFYIYQEWNADRQICKLFPPSDTYAQTPSGLGGCAMHVAFARAGTADIPSGSSIDLQVFNGTDGGAGPWKAGVSGIPDDQYDQILVDLATPDDYSLTTGFNFGADNFGGDSRLCLYGYTGSAGDVVETKSGSCTPRSDTIRMPQS